MTTKARKRTSTGAAIPRKDLDALRELAKENESSVSAELRIAIRNHLQANGKEATA